MRASLASETAIRVAAMRAVHQIVDADPKIILDPHAVGLSRAASETDFQVALSTHEQPGMRHLRANFALRNRLAEDRLAEAARRGVSQYLVLGAGLDTFGYRQPGWAADMRIVEIDHPASQAFKIEALHRAGISIPSNVSFLPIDFGRDAIAGKLAEAPLEPTKPIFVSWLGVTQYLDRQSIISSLRAVSTWSAGGEIVLTYIKDNWTKLPPGEAEAMQIGESRAAASSEPWISKFSQSAIGELLRVSGFDRMDHMAMESIRQRYFEGRSDGLRPSAGSGIVWAQKSRR